jgi:SAM-dependent methyltransferase
MAAQIAPQMIEGVNKVVRTSRQILTETGREPTAEQVANKLSMSLEKVRKLFEIAGLPIRLDP